MRTWSEGICVPFLGAGDGAGAVKKRGGSGSEKVNFFPEYSTFHPFQKLIRVLLSRRFRPISGRMSRVGEIVLVGR